MLLCRSFLAGFVAGLRSMTAPTLVSWAARQGTLTVADTPFAFLGKRWTPVVLTALAAGELVFDKLPVATDRREPPSFAFRIISGAVCGAAMAESPDSANQAVVSGALAGAAGAVAGTLGGAAARAELAGAFGCDLPAAFTEDAAALALGLAAVNLPARSASAG